MAVLVEAVSVVVRRDSIDQRLAGGWEAFVAAVPTAQFCYDSEIARVGFMADADAETFVAHLRALGLLAGTSSTETDVCIIEQLGRSGVPADWLGVSRLSTPEIGGEVAVAFLKGTTETRVVMPGGWKFEGSASQTPLAFARADDSRFKFLRIEGNVEVYWDSSQHCEVYAARPYGVERRTASALTDPQRDEHNRLWEQVRAISDKYKLYSLVPPFKPGFFASRKMRRAIGLLDRVIELHPGNAAAFWMRGKFLQVLGDYEQSLAAFAKACLIDPNHIDFAREAGISATEAGKLDVAVYYAQQALQVAPLDAGLRTNLAVAHLFAGNVAAAQKEIADASAQEPDDAITRSVLVLVTEVAAGRMRRPTRTSEIDSRALREAAARG